MSHSSTTVKDHLGSSYTEQWLEYRKRNKLFWLVFLTYAPGVAWIGVPLSRLLRYEYVISFVAVIWMVAVMITASYRSFWKCPRCHKSFFHKWWYYNFFAGKCVNCKLPKYAGFDPPSP